MPSPLTEDGEFEGGLLFDGRGYRQETNIINYAYCGDRLGLVRDKNAYFVAEYLGLHKSPQFSLPVWDAVRDPTICASEDEAMTFIRNFVSGEATNESD